VVGLATLPLCAWLFRGLRDQGYAVSKLLGLFIVLILTWGYSFFSHVTWPIIALFVIVVGLISAYLLVKGMVKIDKKLLLRMELIFTIIFLLFVFLRCYSPDYNPYGEKFMDYGMTYALQRDSTWPPYDPWFAGEPQHYYYFGYFAISNLATLSGVPLSAGINLGVATLAALTFTACFGLGFNATGSKKFGLICAIFVIILANLFGFFQFFGPPLINLYPPMYEPVEQLLVSYDTGHPWMIPGLHLEGYPGYIDFNSAMISPLNPENPRNLMGFIDDSIASVGHFSYWTSSRIIPHTINEFPLFSFLHADMHAHVINMPFQLLVLYFVAGFMFVVGRPRWECVALLGILVGVMFGIDSWESPVYAAISLAAITLSFIKNEQWHLKDAGKKLKSVIIPLTSRLLLFSSLAILTMLPFYTLFASGREIGVVEDRTLVLFFVIVHGFFLTAIYSFLLRFCGLRIRTMAVGMCWMGVISGLSMYGYMEGGFVMQLFAVFAVIAGIIVIWLKGIEHQWSLMAGCLWGILLVTSFIIEFQLLFLLVPIILLSSNNMLQSRNILHQFTNLLILTGASIALFCELFYIGDAMGSRFNTVFKMYIQIWVLWGMASGLALYDFRLWFKRNARLSKRAWSAVIIVLILMCSIYVLPATIHRSHSFSADIPTMGGHHISPTLDGLAYIREVYPEEYGAIQFCQGLVGTPVLLEAPGDPYSYSSPVSTFSGLPTVVGWSFHEMNWRDNATLVQGRIEQCRNMYQFEDLETRLETMETYEIEYVYVGHLEERKYGDIVYSNFDDYPNAFEPVYDRSTVYLYDEWSKYRFYIDDLAAEVLDAWLDDGSDFFIELFDSDVSDGVFTINVIDGDGTSETLTFDLNSTSLERRSVIYSIVDD